MQEKNNRERDEQISAFSQTWHQLLKLDQQMNPEQKGLSPNAR